MKKFLSISFMAVLLLSSCVEENVIERSDDHAIVFENTFVDKATRSDITTENIDEFSVYGYINSFLGKIWENERVYKVGSDDPTTRSELGNYPPATGWTYEHLAYWEEDASYFFHAFAPYLSENEAKIWSFRAEEVYPSQSNVAPVAGKLLFENDYKTDLLYAYHERNVGKLGYDKPEAIKLTFEHLLAKVRVKVVNELSNSFATIHLRGGLMNSLVSVASINLPNPESWSYDDDPVNYRFIDKVKYIYHKEYEPSGELGAYEGVGEYITEPFYVIPQKLKGLESSTLPFIHLATTVYQYLVSSNSSEIHAFLQKDLDLEPGMSYQFTITLTDKNFYEPYYLIQFDDISVEEWEDVEEQVVDHYGSHTK